MSEVEFRGIKKVFGSQVIIENFNLKMSSGEFLAIVGPSGCGKSTLLRMLAGLESPTAGAIFIDGERVDQLDPSRRGVGMVFQSYALYPHMSVEENLSFPLRMARLPEVERKRRVREASEMLDLTELLGRKPSQLSGGQKQRVAMGRAIVKRPKVLLFDEPLSNLDAQLRSKVRTEIARLHRQLKSTVIYVTHDQIEAMTLAHRIAVLNRGRLEQLDQPLTVYRSPRTQFVASFIGQPAINFMRAVEIPGVSFPKNTATIGFRPEETKLGSTGQTSEVRPAGIRLGKGKVDFVEALGASTHIHVAFEQKSNAEPNAVSVSFDEKLPKTGDAVEVWVNADSILHFDSEGQRL